MNNGVALSLSQCNLFLQSGDPRRIVIDQQQDLTDVSYTFENGRMKAMAKRPLNTGDATDLVLEADKAYYVILSIGGEAPTMNVWYHGVSSTNTLVCLATLGQNIECKAPAEWDNVPPAMPDPSAAASVGSFGVLAAALLFSLMP